MLIKLNIFAAKTENKIEMNTSIIVCTYNEEKTIFGVVAACCKHNPEAEVIVVDDGSTDDTETILETLAMHYEFAYLKLPGNKGESYAMAHGVEFATGDVVLFLNADVTDVRKEHFSALLEPIYNGKADLVAGSPSNQTIDFGVSPYKSVMGQKAMLREDLLPILEDIREIRFGVESYITLYYQTTGKRIGFVLLNGLNASMNEMEEEHLSLTEGGDLEVANALLSNFDLITKRLQNNLQKTQNYTKSTITSVQLELNKRMIMLKERMTTLEVA